MGVEKQVTILGAIFQDILALTDKLPAVGETSPGHSIYMTGGGKGANQAVQCARMGMRTNMIAQTGNDPQGKFVKSILREEGINCEYVFVADQEQTGCASIFADANGDNMIVTAPGASTTIHVEDVKKAEKMIKESSLFITQLETNMECTLYGLKTAKEAGVTTILNPAPAAELPEEIYQYTDFITPNETECEFYTGILRKDFSDIREWASSSAEYLKNKGVKNVLITLGSKGVYFKNQESEFIVPAMKVKAVDTTAAGDSFHGGFAYGLMQEMDMETCCKIGNACGAVTSSGKGAQSSIQKKEVIFNFIKTGMM